jgi:hypothetical protein
VQYSQRLSEKQTKKGSILFYEETIHLSSKKKEGNLGGKQLRPNLYFRLFLPGLRKGLIQ